MKKTIGKKPNIKLQKRVVKLHDKGLSFVDIAIKEGLNSRQSARDYYLRGKGIITRDYSQERIDKSV